MSKLSIQSKILYYIHVRFFYIYVKVKSLDKDTETNTLGHVGNPSHSCVMIFKTLYLDIHHIILWKGINLYTMDFSIGRPSHQHIWTIIGLFQTSEPNICTQELHKQ